MKKTFMLAAILAGASMFATMFVASAAVQEPDSLPKPDTITPATEFRLMAQDTVAQPDTIPATEFHFAETLTK